MCVRVFVGFHVCVCVCVHGKDGLKPTKNNRIIYTLTSGKYRKSYLYYMLATNVYEHLFAKYMTVSINEI